MSNQTIILITAIFASPFIGVLISSFFTRRKTGAEANNLHISGEINIGEAWQKYGLQMQNDLKALSERFETLSKEFEKIKVEKERIAEENFEKDIINKKIYAQNQELVQQGKQYLDRIGILESKVVDLEREVEKYKGQSSPEHLAQVAHQAIDMIKDKTVNSQS